MIARAGPYLPWNRLSLHNHAATITLTRSLVTLHDERFSDRRPADKLAQQDIWQARQIGFVTFGEKKSFHINGIDSSPGPVLWRRLR